MQSWKNLIAAHLAAFSLISVADAQSLPGDDRPWHRLDTAHFTFLTQLDADNTERLANDLERLRQVLEQLTPDRQLSSPNLTYIYLFADYEAFLPFQLRRDGQAVDGVSYFIAHPHANYAALNADPQIEPTRFLYSQFIHQLLSEQLPQLPLWFRQGLAEYYGTFEGDTQGAKIGLPSRQHLQSLGYSGQLQLVTSGPAGEAQDVEVGLDTARVLSLQQSPADPFVRNLYLAKSWGLVHYLLNDPERRQRTLDFVRQVMRGDDAATAFAAAFPIAPQELEAQVRAYLTGDRLPFLRVVMPLDASQGGLFRPLPRHETLFYLGDLLLHSAPDRRLEAANYFEGAVALARAQGIDHGPSHAALGEVAELAGNTEAASRSYALAIEHAGGDALVQFLYGQSLLASLGQRPPGDEATAARLADAIAAFESSTEARPDFAEAWAHLGFAYGLQDTPSGDPTQALAKALELLPGRTDIALNLLLAHAKEGQRDGADAMLRRLQWLGAPQSDLSRAQEILLQMDYREANRLIRQKGRMGDAIALFARIHAQSQDPALRQRAAGRMTDLATTPQQTQFVTLFVQVVAMRDQPEPDLRELMTLLDDLTSTATSKLQKEEVAALRQQVLEGPHWQPMATGSEASLRGLDAVSTQVVWAGGSDGTVLRTVDGGATWSRLPVAGAETLQFRDIEALDDQRAVLMTAGQPARIYRTEDGGATFILAHESPHPSAFFDSMAFWDARHGVVMSDPVNGHLLLLTTDDGGASWQEVAADRLQPTRDGEAGFAASGTNVAVADKDLLWVATGGAAARVHFSTDRGDTWRVAETPLRSGTPSSGIFSIAFRDPLHGVAVGGDYEDPQSSRQNVARSQDGGQTWQAIGGTPPAGHRACVVHLPSWGPNVWLAIGRAGADLSTDDGESWQAFGDQGFYTLSVADDGSVWAAGDQGRVARLRWAI